MKRKYSFSSVYGLVCKRLLGVQKEMVFCYHNFAVVVIQKVSNLRFQYRKEEI